MYIKSKNSEVLSAMLHKCIAEIAQATQSSASAVSKVMNHRGGVQADRRYQIYRYIAEHAIEVPAPADIEIYAILPDVPVFFWHELSFSLESEYLGERDKLNIYSSISSNRENEYIIVKYLEHAFRCGAKSILLSTPFSPSVIQAIRTVSCAVPVFLLTEDGDITGDQIYFIGSDAYMDGRMLAEYYEQQDSSGENILIFYCSEMKNHVRRVEGFTGRLRQSGKYRFRLIHFPLIKTKDYASRLARLLHSIHEQFPFDCIFSPDGYTPYVCGAIKKLGKEGQICCVGFEDDPANGQYAADRILSAVVKQNIAGQVKLAAEIARSYCTSGQLPDQHEYYVPSEILRYEAGSLPV
mgnify:FL=1|jgi:hypothetical protein